MVALFALSATLLLLGWPAPAAAQCLSEVAQATDPQAEDFAEFVNQRAREGLVVLGATCLPAAFSLEAAGPPPTEPGERAEWVDDAVESILARYHGEGFSAARAWHRVEADAIFIEVDEGRMHRIAFVGANALEKLLLSDNLHLSDGMLHEPSLKASLADIGDIYGLRAVGWRVQDGDEYVVNELGGLVPNRVLVVQLVSEEEQGWGVSVGVRPPWGLIVGGTHDARGVLREGDHTESRLDIAFPLHEYVFEEEPRFRWVYGKLGTTYRFAPIRGGRVAPLASVQSSLANYRRADLDLDSAYVNQNGIGASLRAVLSDTVTQTLGLQLWNGNVVHVVLASEEASFDEPQSTARIALVSHTGLVFDDSTLRSDLRDTVDLDLTVAHSGDGALLRAGLEGQWALALKGDDLIFGGRGIYLAGDVRFYDEEQLAGRHQRVFFSDQYWVREAGQVEVAYRLRLRRSVKLGVYHDLSAFRDRTQGGAPWALANAAGGAVHLLLVDQFAFDVYYGAGWSPGGFSHNMMLGLRSVY